MVVAEFDIDKNLEKKRNTLITFNGTEMPYSNSSFYYQIDLMEFLTQWVDFVGFSASTGGLTEQNVIQSWEFNSTLNNTALTNSSDVTKHTSIKHNGLNTIVLAWLCYGPHTSWTSNTHNSSNRYQHMSCLTALQIHIQHHWANEIPNHQDQVAKWKFHLSPTVDVNCSYWNPFVAWLH